MKTGALRRPFVFMIYETKNIICPQCRKVMGTRQVPYERSTWKRENEIMSDMICRECRRKVEIQLTKKADYRPAE